MLLNEVSACCTVLGPQAQHRQKPNKHPKPQPIFLKGVKAVLPAGNTKTTQVSPSVTQKEWLKRTLTNLTDGELLNTVAGL